MASEKFILTNQMLINSNAYISKIFNNFYASAIEMQ